MRDDSPDYDGPDHPDRLAAEIATLRLEKDSLSEHAKHLFAERSSFAEEANRLRAEVARLGQWIDAYKREQESIIGRHMAEVARLTGIVQAVETLPTMNPSFASDALGRGYALGWNAALNDLRAALNGGTEE